MSNVLDIRTTVYNTSTAINTGCPTWSRTSFLWAMIFFLHFFLFHTTADTIFILRARVHWNRTELHRSSTVKIQNGKCDKLVKIEVLVGSIIL